MTESVTIGCGARLHLGFLDLHGGLGRRFGSLGLALTAPQTVLTLRRAGARSVRGPEAARAGRYLDTVAAALGLRDAHALLIETAMPAHAGLGSGTQLALAVATALRRLHGLAPDLRGDAALLGRGARSGIGIALFASGGLALDGGRGAAAAPPPLLARLDVPEAWRVLLLLDLRRAGLAGAAERDAFAALPPMAAEKAAELCRLVLMQALPAVAEGDLAGFGEAVTRLQRAVGDHFAPAQGGRFASPRVAAALERLAALGAHGLGQSSWGPSGFAFAPDPDAAEWLRRRLVAGGDMPEVLICRPRNHGADVTELE
jgi:beta-ribofuranosylaminobenzene 5'-phosphate synthase